VGESGEQIAMQFIQFVNAASGWANTLGRTGMVKAEMDKAPQQNLTVAAYERAVAELSPDQRQQLGRLLEVMSSVFNGRSDLPPGVKPD
jgi:hypothetical protein